MRTIHILSWPCYLPFSFVYKEAQQTSLRPSMDLPTDDGVVRRNVLKSLPTFPPDIYNRSNHIYGVVSIVCCVHHVCRKKCLCHLPHLTWITKNLKMYSVFLQYV